MMKEYNEHTKPRELAAVPESLSVSLFQIVLLNCERMQIKQGDENARSLFTHVCA